MIKSETLGKLALALSKAQATIEGSRMDASNPFFKSKYSTLASVWDACRKALSENELSVTQTATFLPEHPEMVAFETTLMHSSGEFMSGIMVAKPIKSDPQSVGSVTTYLRRYSLAAIVGIAPEDDDGNAGSGKAEEGRKEEKKKPPPPAPARQAPPPPPPPDDVGDFEPFLTAEEQAGAAAPLEPLAVGTELRTKIDGMIQEAGIDATLFKQWLFLAKKISKKFKNPSLSSMSIKDAEGMIEPTTWQKTLKQFSLWVDARDAGKAA